MTVNMEINSNVLLEQIYLDILREQEVNKNVKRELEPIINALPKNKGKRLQNILEQYQNNKAKSLVSKMSVDLKQLFINSNDNSFQIADEVTRRIEDIIDVDFNLMTTKEKNSIQPKLNASDKISENIHLNKY
jgi:DNA primase catalytic subunit